MRPRHKIGALPAGMAVLIVEQKVREVLNIADRVYVLRNGRVSFTGPAADLHDDRSSGGCAHGPAGLWHAP